MSKRKALIVALNVIFWAGISLGIFGACTGNAVLAGVAFGVMAGGALLGAVALGVVCGLKDALKEVY